MTDTFTTAFESFLAGAKTMHAAYMEGHFAGVLARNGAEHAAAYRAAVMVPATTSWRVDMGKRYARVVHDGSAFCFVEIATGNVLKCDGWKRPAKGVRSNIYNAKNGLDGITPTGAAYFAR